MHLILTATASCRSVSVLCFASASQLLKYQIDRKMLASELFFNSVTYSSIFIFVFLPFQGRAKSIDPRFEACAPRRCGNSISISFPFWIDPQPRYCGYPGFNLDCKDGAPVIKMPDGENDYRIREIFYDNQTLLAVNEDYLRSGSCPRPLYNLTFPKIHAPFNVSSSNSYLYFFYNCIALPPPGSQYFPVSCLSNDTNKSFAMIDNSARLNMMNFSRGCELSIVGPVGIGGRDLVEILTRHVNYTELLVKGFLVGWTANNCTRCSRSGGRCGFNETSHFVCLCSDRPHAGYCRGRGSSNNNNRTVTAVSSAVAGAVIVLICTFLIFIFREGIHKAIFFWNKEHKDDRDVEKFLKNYGSVVPKRYHYSDLKKMTNSFKDKLGQGGFGGVFKGKLQDGRLVAVKVLSNSKCNGEDFVNEVASIGRTNHMNIVTLLGFCSNRSKRALIYEFMHNGSLEQFIYGKARETNPLGWKKLYEIAIGIARGLDYLHRGCCTRIVHLDIKPHNILLDKDFQPKISDFGLAKICPPKESIISMLGVRGTVGYIAPEVFCRNFGGVSHKSDVYSYGMMVLEMVGGRSNIEATAEKTSEIYFPDWIYKRVELNEHLELHGVTTREEEDIARKMIIVALWCIQVDPADRPTTGRVVEMLEGSIESLPVPPRPFLSSPSRARELHSPVSTS